MIKEYRREDLKAFLISNKGLINPSHIERTLGIPHTTLRKAMEVNANYKIPIKWCNPLGKYLEDRLVKPFPKRKKITED